MAKVNVRAGQDGRRDDFEEAADGLVERTDRGIVAVGRHAQAVGDVGPHETLEVGPLDDRPPFGVGDERVDVGTDGEEGDAGHVRHLDGAPG